MIKPLSAQQHYIIETLKADHPRLNTVTEKLIAAYDMMRRCFEQGGKLLICGNGGSCADAEHIAGELMKGFLMRRPLTAEQAGELSSYGDDGRILSMSLQRGLPAIPLNVTALSTAVINDIGGDMTFAQQVMALGRPGDILLGLSTSGNARNVHLAALTAKSLGMGVVALTGRGGGRMMADADVLISVPEDETYKIQELQLPVYHALCALLEDAFFEE